MPSLAPPATRTRPSGSATDAAPGGMTPTSPAAVHAPLATWGMSARRTSHEEAASRMTIESAALDLMRRAVRLTFEEICISFVVSDLACPPSAARCSCYVSIAPHAGPLAPDNPSPARTYPRPPTGDSPYPVRSVACWMQLRVSGHTRVFDRSGPEVRLICQQIQQFGGDEQVGRAAVVTGSSRAAAGLSGRLRQDYEVCGRRLHRAAGQDAGVRLTISHSST